MQYTDQDWLNYINITRNWRPRPLLVEALTKVKNRGVAVDLGSGALNESRFLLCEGFNRVFAVDNAIDATQAYELLAVSDELATHFQFVNSAIEDFPFPTDQNDLVNAQFVLPFIKKEKFSEVLSDLKKSLKADGIFVGQFFGYRDSWAALPSVSVFSENEARSYLSDLEILHFHEEEGDGQTAAKVFKHWHLFHFIAQKK
ncbi:MAG: methyltransferase domain-containing protein [Patescibacteria group bacterium]